MRESLEYLNQTYGTDSQRQPILAAQPEPRRQQSNAL